VGPVAGAPALAVDHDVVLINAQRIDGRPSARGARDPTEGLPVIRSCGGPTGKWSAPRVFVPLSDDDTVIENG